MKTKISAALLFTLLLTVTTVFADSPPTNTIPILSMKTGQGNTCEDITMDVLLMLLDHNFDGIWVEGAIGSGENAEAAANYCDSTKAIMVLAPGLLQKINNAPLIRWGRYTAHAITADSAFIHPDPDDYKSIDDCANADSILGLITARAADLSDDVADHPSIWYYDIFNEGPARQLKNMLNDTSAVDDYFPSMFTLNTMMTTVCTSSVFAWEKWKSDLQYTGTDGPTVSVCHSMLHTIESNEWAGFSGIHLGTATTQANSVNAYFDMQALCYDSTSGPYALVDITPERMDLNAYPVRFAGYKWQTGPADSITVLGSATDLWMLDHYELLMDSTFIPAGNHPDGPFPIHYHPQAFGRSGGEAVWEIVTTPTPDTTIAYKPYGYRIPSPAEFRMLCNIGLLRGAKGVFPYALRSNSSWDDDTLTAHSTGLLDEDLIPFDAPYEYWVYRERPVGDYYYAPPDSIPPWTAADGSQFDPLYSVPARPDTVSGDQQTTQDYLEWKFSAYGRLWNSVRGTFRQIAWIAPELSRLWWWFSGSRYDNARIYYGSSPEPLYFADPHVRVFTDSTESTCYLFYVNRFCRADDNPFAVEVEPDNFPTGTAFSEYALDHSRRFLIEGSEASGVYTFRDTLDAGQARLLEMFDDYEGLNADLRITDPDIFMILPDDSDTLTDNACPVGTPYDIYAWVYNMGTDSASNVKVWLEDITTDTVKIDSVYLDFDGLSTSSCYQTDRALASFNTIIPEPSGIGVNIYRVRADRVPGEPDGADNSASLVFMVRPRDYATEVLDDPWDMSPPSPPISPPAWKTFDIDSLTGSWGSYTDSISGMFEGRLTTPINTNGLYLNTGTGRDDWIDADLYHNFSIAGYSEFQTDITVHWTDSSDDSYSVDIEEELKGTATDIGPVDLYGLSSGDWTGMVKTIWLEFSGTNLTTDIRIGWVRLTE